MHEHLSIAFKKKKRDKPSSGNILHNWITKKQQKWSTRLGGLIYVIGLAPSPCRGSRRRPHHHLHPRPLRQKDRACSPFSKAQRRPSNLQGPSSGDKIEQALAHSDTSPTCAIPVRSQTHLTVWNPWPPGFSFYLLLHKSFSGLKKLELQFLSFILCNHGLVLSPFDVYPSRLVLESPPLLLPLDISSIKKDQKNKNKKGSSTHPQCQNLEGFDSFIEVNLLLILINDLFYQCALSIVFEWASRDWVEVGIDVGSSQGIDARAWGFNVGMGIEVGLLDVEVCLSTLETAIGKTFLVLFFPLEGAETLGFGPLALWWTLASSLDG